MTAARRGSPMVLVGVLVALLVGSGVYLAVTAPAPAPPDPVVAARAAAFEQAQRQYLGMVRLNTRSAQVSDERLVEAGTFVCAAYGDLGNASPAQVTGAAQSLRQYYPDLGLTIADAQRLAVYSALICRGER